MTEAKWLACNDPTPMLGFLRGKVIARKMRLFACACCYRIAHFLCDDRSRVAIEVLEKYADGQASDEQLIAAGLANDETLGSAGDPGDAAAGAVGCAIGCSQDGPSDYGTDQNAEAAARWAACAFASVAPDQKRLTRTQRTEKATEKTVQARLLRDIFGNPFRSVTFSPSWRTDTAVTLAHQMYESRDFSAMPILADAIQDAGCENEEILNHCRQPGTHVRGCWVVDLMLGKE